MMEEITTLSGTGSSRTVAPRWSRGCSERPTSCSKRSGIVCRCGRVVRRPSSTRL